MKTTDELVEEIIRIASGLDVNGDDYIEWKEQLRALIEKDVKEQYPDTEADGYVFCGKCGKMK